MTEAHGKIVIDKASQALAEYCIRSNIGVVVTGVSGGLDSAVTLGLAKKASEFALQKGVVLRSLGLILPCQSDPQHAVLGKKVIENFGAELLEIDLTGVFETLEKNLLRTVAADMRHYHPESAGERYRVAQGNVKARLRMTLGTYFVANLVNGLVLSTDNWSEYWMGFWTLHGDVGDFGMIQELWKGDEIPLLAKLLGVPQEVIDAEPTDGLGVHHGGDEAQMGAPYAVVDRVLQSLIQQGIDLNGSREQLKNLPVVPGVAAETVEKIAKRALENAFKRKNPINLTRSQLGL